MAQFALEITGVSHSFGTRRVLHDVSFALPEGSFTALLGLNGAGKTTLFSLITRLYDHGSGTIRVFDDELKTNPSAALARMGIVFQQPTLDLDLTVEQNLSYHAALRGMPRRIAHERITRETARMELQDRRGEKVRQLSGGQRRRVEIARALLDDPSLLLLDEPTVGLDIASRQFLIDHVRRLCREQGIAVLWATHLIDEVDDTARLIVLHRGRVLAHGPVTDVCTSARASTSGEAFNKLTQEG
jgi:ABC-2 type transport system ATP-binding protein